MTVKFSAALALLTAVALVLFGLMAASAMLPPTGTALTCFGLAAAFAVCGVLAFFGRTWPLTVVWAVMLAWFLYTLFADDVDAGLMDGGVVILAVLLYLVAGLVLSFSLPRKADV